MGNCAKCGKNVSFVESHSHWNNQIRRNGYIDFKGFTKSEHCVEVPKLKGKNLCLNCARDIFFGEQFKVGLEKGKPQVIVTVNSVDGISKHIESVSKAAEKYGYLFKQETHVLNNIGFGVAVITMTMVFEKTQETRIFQVTLDFSSLKDVMSKGGVVMTTCKCPNCNAMVDIPETGKVLICKYCGTPIKAVDIFEKIKSLISGNVKSEKQKKEETKTQLINDYESEKQIKEEPKQKYDNKPDWYKEALKQHQTE